jgi:flagellar biosynthesis anti-sigma factor FlgM
MKIDPYSTGAIERQQSLPDAAAAPAQAPRTTAADDHVHLSSDLQIVRNATTAVQASPEIRQDVVQRMRARLEAGQVGADPEHLADAMIDAWMETPSPEGNA